MNEFSVFLYPFKSIIGTKKTKKKLQSYCTLRSEHRCHEQRREIYTVNISNKTEKFAGILFYTFTDIPVVLLLVKYVPQTFTWSDMVHKNYLGNV